MNTPDELKIWQQPLPGQLLDILGQFDNTASLSRFLRDVLTEKEIIEIAARFEAARLLAAGVSYDAIQAQTKLSTRTIARISAWRKQGTGGYEQALNIVKQTTPSAHHSHMSPARAE